MDGAGPPVRPIRPNLTLNILLALLVSATGGVGLAFAVEYRPGRRMSRKLAGRVPPEFLGRLETALRKVSGLSVPIRFIQDETLLAGLHIVIGAWVLTANVRDELKGFAEFASAPR